MDVTVTVYPEEGEFSRIAKALLAVADSPYQVVTVSNPRMGFRVPEEVFDRFHAQQAQEWEERDEAPQQEPPKRRGRPRKAAAAKEDSAQEAADPAADEVQQDGSDTEVEEE